MSPGARKQIAQVKAEKDLNIKNPEDLKPDVPNDSLSEVEYHNPLMFPVFSDCITHGGLKEILKDQLSREFFRIFSDRFHNTSTNVVRDDCR